MKSSQAVRHFLSTNNEPPGCLRILANIAVEDIAVEMSGPVVQMNLTGSPSGLTKGHLGILHSMSTCVTFFAREDSTSQRDMTEMERISFAFSRKEVLLFLDASPPSSLMVTEASDLRVTMISAERPGKC